ncbi:Na+/H+ antiporter [Blastocladiella emersonii ATCC 22665]|nr:Na+/H+ antiporter [Blastocladiella emersonii ATCC 22665]
MIDSILQITDINRISLAIGSFLLVFCAFSLLLRERLYVSETTCSLLFGILIGINGLGLIDSEKWNDKLVGEFMFEACRFLIAIQVLIAGVELSPRYLWNKLSSVSMLLFVLMTIKWLFTGLIIMVILGFGFLDSLIIASCVAPTDPVLAASILKGKYAEKHVPLHIRELLSAESGANDGLGFPFLFLALYLRTYRSPKAAMVRWVWYILGYQIVLSVILGAVIGFVASKILSAARRNNWIDRPSRLSYGISLSILCVGLVGILGSDDLLAAFVAGNVLNWNSKLGKETHGEAVNDTLDQLLTLAFLVFFGAVFPFAEIAKLYAGWKLFLFCMAVLFLRRLPWTIMLFKFIPEIKSFDEAVFVGWFGPMGVSGLFYAYLLEHDKSTPARVRREVVPLVSLLVLLSVMCHGLSIASLKLTRKVARGNNPKDLASAFSNAVFPAKPDPTASGEVGGKHMHHKSHGHGHHDDDARSDDGFGDHAHGHGFHDPYAAGQRIDALSPQRVNQPRVSSVPRAATQFTAQHQREHVSIPIRTERR